MISVIIPASNEATFIGDCLDSLIAGPAPRDAEIIVVANGCHDDTAAVALAREGEAHAAGWNLTVIDLDQGGKSLALNAGDVAAKHAMRAYLDADVVVDPDLIVQLAEALAVPEARYASGTMRIAPARTATSRAYGRIYSKLPFMTQTAPGAGLFAVNAEGRGRWDRFPDIISDDTYVRLLFSPRDRVMVSAGYDWPLVEGFANLVRVRRRQNRGVDEIMRDYPKLTLNDDKPTTSLRQKLLLMIGDPIGFAVYASVALATRLPARDASGWRRGR